MPSINQKGSIQGFDLFGVGSIQLNTLDLAN
ncbi:hypothetical protein Niako_4586 [Niastella koreensis GR20-10]|uniref:Uncharacterized protein n=1 Tax=Niastella koreensis (strain DSM 17620 / KACC 11465 / NBRC 106392 / GR20-10) TaxID=700598 RepID=G8TL05_NIAKG|nr:hypothetical protein Niako_4586 [Niastella koreensis GR20-10]